MQDLLTMTCTSCGQTLTLSRDAVLRIAAQVQSTMNTALQASYIAYPCPQCHVINTVRSLVDAVMSQPTA